jgi:hypothetical protein
LHTVSHEKAPVFTGNVDPVNGYEQAHVSNPAADIAEPKAVNDGYWAIGRESEPIK